ncbi:response regulator transcription factor [Streptococcus sp. ZY1909104]|uniref:response regulator n=1 Tax=Streptococcus sp. ZY1909104 TaxID=3233335 RepID=UPI00349FB8A7
MKILLIDDHKLFSQSIKMILELSETIDYVDLVENFQSVDDIDYSRYDIILIDINLTSIYETDGLALAEEMIKKERGIKIVILTGYSKKIYEYRAQKMGAYAFIDKSIDPDKLLTQLKGIYSGKKYFSVEEIVDILSEREIEVLESVRESVRNGLTIVKPYF